MPAKTGNTNALKTGLFSSSGAIRSPHIRRQMRVVRSQLERAVVAIRGEVTIEDAAAIRAVVKIEGHGAIIAGWLQERGDQMSDESRLMYSREIARTGQETMKIVRSLGLTDGLDAFERAWREMPRLGAKPKEDVPAIEIDDEERPVYDA